MEQEIFGRNEAAEFLGIRVYTITQLCKSNAIRHVRIGGKLKFRKAWLLDFMDRNSSPVLNGNAIFN